MALVSADCGQAQVSRLLPGFSFLVHDTVVMTVPGHGLLRGIVGTVQSALYPTPHMQGASVIQNAVHKTKVG